MLSIWNSSGNGVSSKVYPQLECVHCDAELDVCIRLDDDNYGQAEVHCEECGEYMFIQLDIPSPRVAIDENDWEPVSLK